MNNKLKVILGVIAILLVVSLPILAACGGKPVSAGGSKNLSGTVKQTRVKAQVNGNTVTVPVSTLEKNGGNISFRLETATDSYGFMVYQYGDQTYVRADVCVPCGSESFTLSNGVLICDSCATQFDAKTGTGLRGVKACMTYAKKASTFEISNGNIVMDWNNLAVAYSNTLNRK